MGVEFDLRVLSGIKEVVDEMQFVAVFGGITRQLATITEVTNEIGGFVLIFSQRGMADVI
jgi:hypothetical protein